MAGLGAGGYGSLFGGLKAISEYEAKRKVAKDKSIELYVSLLKDDSLRMKKDSRYKPGMTREQVLDLFEENPENGSKAVWTTQYPDPEGARKMFPSLKNVEDSAITVGLVSQLQRNAEFEDKKERGNRGLDLREQALSDSQAKELQRVAEKKGDVMLKLTQFAENKDISVDELLEKNPEIYNDILSAYGRTIGEKPTDSTYASFLRTVTLGKYNPTESTIVPTDTATPSVTPPAISTPEPKVVAKPSLDEQTKSQIVDTAMALAKKDGFSFDKLDNTAKKGYINKAKKQVIQSKTTTPGVTQNPQVLQGLQQNLQQPQGSPVLAPSSVQAPTASPKMTINPANIAQGSTGTQDPKLSLLNAAYKFRKSLAESPYEPSSLLNR